MDPFSLKNCENQGNWAYFIIRLKEGAIHHFDIHCSNLDSLHFRVNLNFTNSDTFSMENMEKVHKLFCILWICRGKTPSKCPNMLEYNAKSQMNNIVPVCLILLYCFCVWSIFFNWHIDKFQIHLLPQIVNLEYFLNFLSYISMRHKMCLYAMNNTL